MGNIKFPCITFIAKFYRFSEDFLHLKDEIEGEKIKKYIKTVIMIYKHPEEAEEFIFLAMGK